tara:strand:+ start:7953 stop:8408 length:456 start_codon:yes stop_codon:yes gene_type:complete
MRSVKGFTLIELMVALAVLAIVVVIGFPAFNNVFERSRADSDASELLRAFNIARLEAINHSEDVNINATTDDNWARDLEIVRGGTVIRRYAGLPSGATITTTGNVDSIVFDSLGGLRTPSNAVIFTYTRGDSTKSLVVCPTGRILTGAACI